MGWKIKTFALVLGLIAFAAPRAVWADTAGIMQFNVSGTFEDGSVLTGTITINTTTGVPIADSLQTTGPTSLGTSFAPIPFLGYGEDQPQFFFIQAYGSLNDSIDLYLDVPNLIAYSGGAICGLTTGCVSTMGNPENQGPVFSYATDPIYLTEGSLTLPSATPEPSSLLLLGIGVLGLSVMAFWRKDAAQYAAA